jgi:hypothetical protein
MTSAIGFLIKRGNASVSSKPVEKMRTKPIEVQPSAGSAEIAISQAAFVRDLEEEVATINAAKAMLGLGQSAVAPASS